MCANTSLHKRLWIKSRWTHFAMWDTCGISAPLIDIDVQLTSFSTNILCWLVNLFMLLQGSFSLWGEFVSALNRLTDFPSASHMAPPSEETQSFTASVWSPLIVDDFALTFVLQWRLKFYASPQRIGSLHSSSVTGTVGRQSVACVVTLSYVIRSTFFTHEGKTSHYHSFIWHPAGD